MIPLSRKEPIDGYLNGFINYERYKYFPRKVNLNDYKIFLKKAGNPQQTLSPSVLIAGTNGKGSTAAIVSSILTASGYRAGLFSSPHLFSYRERISINGKPISKKNFRKCIRILKPFLDEPYQRLRRTFFEVLTTAAFVHFSLEKTDINILEVGLGGRKDSTNVVNPLVSVITPIGFDHTRTLGTILSSIAREKCGIIRNNGTVVSSFQHKNAMETIERIVKERNAYLFAAKQHIRIESVTIKDSGIRFRYNNEGYFLALSGAFQLENLKTALLIIQILKEKGFPVSRGALRKGLKQCVLKGRFDIVEKDPLTILDGAHNPSAVRKLVTSLKGLYPDRKPIFIFSCLSSKDRKGMAAALDKSAYRVILTRIHAERAADMSDLKQVFGKAAALTDSIEGALKLARKLSDVDTVIMVTGSMYLVAEAYGALLAKG
ncbi:MAG: bifunctional folylpolyglutamate synthase/dihydrofolate synthase [Candidatus Cloacimonadota bacterium]|nr:MAG: bifunctional folylpolyglutamate synthase/dihydrofolate synthase [Candidatus Cloacimonadota bacterium]